MEERRSTQRRKVLKAGTIAFGQSSVIDCQVRNISEKGASLEVASPVGIPERFTLIIAQDGIRCTARVKWRKATRIGVEFEKDDEPESAPAASGAAIAVTGRKPIR
jgi:hypothetical protein